MWILWIADFMGAIVCGWILDRKTLSFANDGRDAVRIDLALNEIPFFLLLWKLMDWFNMNQPMHIWNLIMFYPFYLPERRARQMGLFLYFCTVFRTQCSVDSILYFPIFFLLFQPSVFIRLLKVSPFTISYSSFSVPYSPILLSPFAILHSPFFLIWNGLYVKDVGSFEIENCTREWGKLNYDTLCYKYNELTEVAIVKVLHRKICTDFMGMGQISDAK